MKLIDVVKPCAPFLGLPTLVALYCVSKDFNHLSRLLLTELVYSEEKLYKLIPFALFDKVQDLIILYLRALIAWSPSGVEPECVATLEMRLVAVVPKPELIAKIKTALRSLFRQHPKFQEKVEQTEQIVRLVVLLFFQGDMPRCLRTRSNKSNDEYDILYKALRNTVDFLYVSNGIHLIAFDPTFQSFQKQLERTKARTPFGMVEGDTVTIQSPQITKGSPINVKGFNIEFALSAYSPQSRVVEPVEPVEPHWWTFSSGGAANWGLLMDKYRENCTRKLKHIQVVVCHDGSPFLREQQKTSAILKELMALEEKTDVYYLFWPTNGTDVYLKGPESYCKIAARAIVEDPTQQVVFLKRDD